MLARNQCVKHPVGDFFSSFTARDGGRVTKEAAKVKTIHQAQPWLTDPTCTETMSLGFPQIRTPLELCLFGSLGIYHRRRLKGLAMGAARFWKAKGLAKFMCNRGLRSLALGALLTVLLSGCFGGAVVQTKVVEAADSPDPGPYRIGKADSLEVLVWGRPQLSGRLHVADDGTITVPLIGQTTAAGLTTAELQKQLAHKLSRFVNNPNVTVRVATATSQVFYVLGEVKRAGKYQLMPGEVLSQALAEAGGPTEFANLRKVKIIRYATDRPTEMTVNYKVLASDGDLSADVPISRGDTIVVP